MIEKVKDFSHYLIRIVIQSIVFISIAFNFCRPYHGVFSSYVAELFRFCLARKPHYPHFDFDVFTMPLNPNAFVLPNSIVCIIICTLFSTIFSIFLRNLVAMTQEFFKYEETHLVLTDNFFLMLLFVIFSARHPITVLNGYFKRRKIDWDNWVWEDYKNKEIEELKSIFNFIMHPIKTTKKYYKDHLSDELLKRDEEIRKEAEIKQSKKK